MINLFGMWLVVANIAYMLPVRDGCAVHFTGLPDDTIIVKKPCDEVAAVINKNGAKK